VRRSAPLAAWLAATLWSVGTLAAPDWPVEDGCTAHVKQSVRLRVVMALPNSPGTVAWWRDQVAFARKAFAAVGIGLDVPAPETLPVAGHHVDRPLDRDRLGRAWWRRGEALVLVPERLVDTNGRDRRHGVHWRDRKDRRGEDQRRRWVILARQHPSPRPLPLVLGHELGHFFGLHHGKEPASLMNKAGGAERPPLHKRRFVARERRTMLRRLGQMVAAGTLRMRKCRRAPATAGGR